MKILFSADFHSDFSRLFQLAKKFDLCICCGDIFDYHQFPSDNFKFPLPFFSIKGNKELWGQEKMHKALESCHNFYWLNENLDRLEELTGLQFFGIDHRHVPPTIPENLDVLVSHQPAYGLADQCNDPFRAKMFPHCGNESIRKLIDHFKPEMIVAGHVHHFQEQRLGSVLAVTLPIALINPVLIMEGKKVILSNF
ncbi:MAG: metallophosphoesterase family protein [Candidatus Hodarchaeales archaeon]|jgi:Icc-related predicted phosphoesterase